jgi:hypothetical protein
MQSKLFLAAKLLAVLAFVFSLFTACGRNSRKGIAQ